MTREQYAVCEKRPAYMWLVETNGITTCSEFDVFGVEHPFVDAHLMLQPQDGPFHGAFLNVSDQPKRVHAVAYRPTQMANYYIDVNPGDALIWKKVVLGGLNVYTGEKREEFEVLIFGCVHSDFHEDVLMVVWDGTAHGFESEAAAYRALA